MHQRLPLGVGISLADILPHAKFFGARDIRVTSCSGDSRSCQPGDLFIAMDGARRDGHEFAQDAVARGATAVLAERLLPALGVPQCIVSDTRKAYGHLCQSLAGHPSRHLKVIGITGTNGKTTTSYLVASVLEAGGYLSGVMGTLGYFDGVDVETASLTTPDPATMAAWMGRMHANGCSHAALEVSSHALCLGRVNGIEFDTAVITNIRHDHLDFHGTQERYRAAKARLLGHLRPEGLVVLNIDDPGSASLLDRVDGPALSIGIDNAAEVTATPVEQTISEQTFLLGVDQATIPVRTGLIGRHNIYNCLLAAAVGIGHGIELSAVVRGLEAVRKIPGRLERIECGQPFGVFVDYAHTSDALLGSLETLRELTRGRLLCVFGAGGDRDRSKRPLMGRAVESLADEVIITSDNPRTEDPRSIMHEIADGLAHRGQARLVADRGDAIRWALNHADEDDCVLIAGKGHECYQIVGHQRLYFDDREVAKEFLYDQPRQAAYRASA